MQQVKLSFEKDIYKYISFSKETFADMIKEKIKKYNLKGSEIVLELTESSFSSHMIELKKNIEELRLVGVEVAMVDSSRGYSCLARLKDLQLDYLKLDRSFIVSLLDENGQEIIKPLISLAKDIRAEGIETEKQYDILRSLGCQYGQPSQTNVSCRSYLPIDRRD